MEGLGGAAVEGDRLLLRPRLPPDWESYEFSLHFRGSLINVYVAPEGITLKRAGADIKPYIRGGRLAVQGSGQWRPCAQVLLANILPKDALIAGNGLMHFVDNLVAIVFPSTVGVLIILRDPITGIFDALTFFASASISGLLPNVGVYDNDSGFSICETFGGRHNSTVHR
jgi:hypothetical protein